MGVSDVDTSVTTDEDMVIERARHGDSDAIGQLFDDHWTDAWRVAHGILRSRDAAQDVAQDAFLAAIDALGSFDGRRPFRVWLHRIVVNRAIDAQRRGRRSVALDQATDLQMHDAVADPLLAAAVRRLDVDRRAVIVLRYGLDMSPPEIAATLDIPVGTVNSRLARGLSDLRSDMEADT